MNADCRVQFPNLNEFSACVVVRNGVGRQKACDQGFRGLPVTYMGIFQEPTLVGVVNVKIA
jgi:hypothetical protein